MYVDLWMWTTKLSILEDNILDDAPLHSNATAVYRYTLLLSM